MYKLFSAAAEKNKFIYSFNNVVIYLNVRRILGRIVIMNSQTLFFHPSSFLLAHLS